jgi:hypothetical protein
VVPGAFHDIGSVVVFLRVTPWQIPGFGLDTNRGPGVVIGKDGASGRMGT